MTRRGKRTARLKQCGLVSASRPRHRPPSNFAQDSCAALRFRPARGQGSATALQLQSCRPPPPAATSLPRIGQFSALLSFPIRLLSNPRNPFAIIKLLSTTWYTSDMLADVESRRCFEPRACLVRGVRLLGATPPRDLPLCPVGEFIASAVGVPFVPRRCPVGAP